MDRAAVGYQSMIRRCGSCGRKWQDLYSKCTGCGRVNPEWRISNDPRIDRSSGCHIWTGSRTKAGYGRFGKKYVHVLIWEEEHGPIQDGLEVCHACDSPSCCNVEHLFLGTHRENMADALGKGRLDMSGLQRRGEWTHCKNGHEFTQANTYRYPDGTRECRICMKERSRKSGARYRARKRSSLGEALHTEGPT